MDLANAAARVAFFDSGLGGLSVLHYACRNLRGEQFVFFADEDNVPYGTKKREDILHFVDEAFAFLSEQNIKAVVVACNTATSVAVVAMRQKYSMPIIGMEPAVKPALLAANGKRVLVVATPVTVNGEKLRRLLANLDAERRVDALALPTLVAFAERAEFSSAVVEAYLRRELLPYKLDDYGALVLGCTHFNYFKDSFRRLLPPDVRIIDGNEGTINELERRLTGINKRGDLPPVPPVYFYSGRRVTADDELRRLEQYMKRLDDMYLL